MACVRRFWCVAAALALTGCAGYRLGPTDGASAGNRSLAVRPVQNRTMEPRLTDALASSLRRQIQQDGTYRLEKTGTADVELETIILRYDRQGLTFDPNDTLTAQEYLIVITAHVVARERLTGRVLVERDVTGKSSLQVGDDLTSAERQNTPLVAEDIARNITALLVEGTW